MNTNHQVMAGYVLGELARAERLMDKRHGDMLRYTTGKNQSNV